MKILNNKTRPLSNYNLSKEHYLRFRKNPEGTYKQTL